MELKQEFFKGLWFRKDTKAKYRFYKSVINATSNGKSRAVDWFYQYKNKKHLLTIGKKQFKIIDYSDKHFTIEMRGNEVIFERIID